MSEKFDAYHRWLAIPPSEQPPNHYRLLGLAKFETDVDVIDSAADRQMAHVRTHQAGKFGDASQKLLNEIAAARVVLLDAERKAAYDATLRANETQIKRAAPLQQAQPLQGEAASASSLRLAKPLTPAAAAPVAPATPTTLPSAQPNSPLPLLIGGGAALLVLLLSTGVGAFLYFGGQPDEQTVVAVVTSPDPVVPPIEPVVPPVDGRQQPPVVLPPVEPPVSPPERSNPPVSDPAPPETPNKEPIDDALAENTSPEDPRREVDPPSDNEPPAVEPPVSEPPRSPIADLFPADAAPTGEALPDKETQASKREQIDGLFDISGARTAAQRTEMAENLLATARDTENDTAAKYVLLEMAREMASNAGDMNLAMQAVDELSAEFQVNALALRATSLAQAADAPTPIAVKAQLIDPGVEVIDELFAADQFVEAAKLIKALQLVAVKTRDKEQRAFLASRQEQGSELFKGFKEAQAAIETLKKSPDDQQAALVAGKYYAFIKGDWQRGLTILSVASDEALKKLAEQELLVPTAKNERLALADAWLKQASLTKGLEADRKRARAAMWFRQAQEDLVGLAKVEVQRKLDSLGKLDVDGGAPLQRQRTQTVASSRPSTTPRPSAQPDVRRGLIHHWTFDETRGTTASDSVGGNDFVFSGFASRQTPWSTGKLGGAAEFLGGATLATTKLPIARQQYTIAFWLKPGRNAGTNPRLVFPSDGSYNWIMLNAENNRGVGFYYNRGTNLVQIRQPALVDTWEHYAVTVDLQKGEAAVYRQGAAASRGAFHDSLPRKVWMLAHNSDPNNHGDSFVGQLDDLRIYERVLTDDEIRSVASQQAEPTAQPEDDLASAPSGEAIDLLTLIDVDKHFVQGRFTRRGGSLVMPEGGFNRIVVPHHPPDEYTLTIDVTRKKDRFQGHDLGLGLVYQGKQCMVLIDRVTGTARGPASYSTISASGARNNGDLASQTNDDPVLATGRRARIVCTVRKESIDVTVDDNALLSYRGTAEWIGIDGPWGVPDRRSLMIGGLNEPFEVHAMTLAPLADASSSPAIASGKAIDLLKLIDPAKHGVLGDWRLVDGELLSPRHPDGMRLQIPTKVPPEYDLDLEVTRNGTGNELAIGLIYQGKQCSVGVDRFSARSTDIVAETNGGRPEVATAAVANLLKPGERSHVKCQVRNDSITVLVNEKEIVKYEGDANWSGMNSGWAVPDKQALMLGAWWAEFRIHSFTLTPVGGGASGSAAAEAAAPRDLLSLIDTKIDAQKGDWRLASGVLNSPPDAEASIRVPYVPVQEYDLDFDIALGNTTADIDLKLPYGGSVLTLKINSDASAKVGVVNSFRCTVRKTGMKFYQNGKLASVVERDPVAKPMRNNTDPFVLITHGTLAKLSALRLTEVSGAGTPLRVDEGAAKASASVYLDDLQQARSQSYASAIGKHGKTNLPVDGKDPQDVSVGGKAFKHALFAAADSNGVSSITYDLGGKYTRFRASAAIADKFNSFAFSGPLKFSLVGDGKVLWTSGEFTRHGQTEAVSVNITGIRTLELRGTCLTNNNICAWCTWIEPQVIP